MATTFKPPATQRVYDVCVIGGGMGGAAAGALLSRRGFRVLLIDEGSASPPVTGGGWQFPAGPTLRPSLRALPAAEALLADLGLATDATRSIAPLDPPLQVLLPRHRLDLAPAAALARELRREWPAEAGALADGLARLATAAELGGALLKGAPPLPPAGLLDRWTLRRAIGRAAKETGSTWRCSPDPRPSRPWVKHRWPWRSTPWPASSAGWTGRPLRSSWAGWPDWPSGGSIAPSPGRPASRTGYAGASPRTAAR